MATVYLAFGSNLGDRRANILSAADKLTSGGVQVFHMSSIIETRPVGGPLQGLFLNAVARAGTEHSPRKLLEICLEIESQLGRVRTQKNGPRTIDIDILLYDNILLNESDLVIPHPRMKDRDFVMGPLRELGVHVDETKGGIYGR